MEKSVLWFTKSLNECQSTFQFKTNLFENFFQFSNPSPIVVLCIYFIDMSTLAFVIHSFILSFIHVSVSFLGCQDHKGRKQLIYFVVFSFQHSIFVITTTLSAANIKMNMQSHVSDRPRNSLSFRQSLVQLFNKVVKNPSLSSLSSCWFYKQTDTPPPTPTPASWWSDSSICRLCQFSFPLITGISHGPFGVCVYL